MKHIAAREAVGLLRFMTWVLCAVGFLALVFTTVNVTRFATSRDVPLPIAILLDPMIGTALAGVLYVDARLASLGIQPPAWSTTVRWGAGCIAALMNSWESLWPDGQIGWPRQADPAAVLLHLTPALLLIALTETIAAYRRCVTDLVHQIGSAEHTEHTTATARPAPSDTEPTATDPEQLSDPRAPDSRGHIPAAVHAMPPPVPRPLGRHTPDHTAPTPLPPPTFPPAHGRAADGDIWQRAIALDAAARAATGKPVSVWRLRTDLCIGPRRARQLHDQLLTHHAGSPPVRSDPPATSADRHRRPRIGIPRAGQTSRPPPIGTPNPS